MYNDFQLADNQSIIAMRQKFDEAENLELQDLREIYDKMLEQRENLLKSNHDGKLNKALEKMEKCIRETSEVLQKESLSAQQKKTTYSQFSHHKHLTPHSGYRAMSLQALLKSQALQNSPDGAYGRIPSANEMNRHSTGVGNVPPASSTHPMPLVPTPNNNMGNTPSTTPPTNNTPNTPPPSNGNMGSTPPNNMNGNTNNNIGNAQPNMGLDTPLNNGGGQNGFNNSNSGANTGETTPPIVNQNTRKRNSPMQGSIISRLAKSLFVNSKASKLQYNIPLKHRNRFHNVISQSEDCHPRRRLITNQIDLIRLLLLFTALRPNCRHLSKVARIANTQLEVLMEII